MRCHQINFHFFDQSELVATMAESSTCNEDATASMTQKSGDNNVCNRCFAASDFPAVQWFDETILHPAISVPAKHVAHRKKQLKSLMLHDRKNVYTVPVLPSIESDHRETVSTVVSSQQRRILIMNVGVTFDDVLSFAHDHESHDANNNNNSNNKEEKDILWIESFPITRGYDDMSVDEVLRKLLPKDHVHEIPSSFELVGHIAHVNLRDDCLPYKYWIGRVILDLNQPCILTVVNKIGTIESDNVFRTFNQEVIAGNSTEPNWSITTVHEHGCCFQLDFRHVYWNSRLSGEHHRLVQLIQKSFKRQCENALNNDEKQQFVVVDLMAGVGPFAIPLTTTISEQTKVAKKPSTNQVEVRLPTQRMTVYANDLNPSSIKFLEINSKKNKCCNLHCSNRDARELLRELQASMVSIDHVIMNLPASAPEFLDAFRGWKLGNLPIIHVYCFGPKCKHEDTTNNVILDRCKKALGCTIHKYSLISVRNISPTKNMY